MSAEHERAKEPLPTRPRGGHPGFVCSLTDAEREQLREKVRAANKRSESRPK